MSDEEDYPGKELVQAAKAKLTKEELDAVTRLVYNKTLEKVKDWICGDLDHIDHSTRAENVIYYRVLWIIGNDNKLQLQVDEGEPSRIQELRKARFSIGELARVFQRSKSTIHAHIEHDMFRKIDT